MVQLKNSWKFGSTYTGVGSRNKLPWVPLVQLRDSEENLEAHIRGLVVEQTTIGPIEEQLGIRAINWTLIQLAKPTGTIIRRSEPPAQV